MSLKKFDKRQNNEYFNIMFKGTSDHQKEILASLCAF